MILAKGKQWVHSQLTLYDQMLVQLHDLIKSWCHAGSASWVDCMRWLLGKQNNVHSQQHYYFLKVKMLQ